MKGLKYGYETEFSDTEVYENFVDLKGWMLEALGCESQGFVEEIEKRLGYLSKMEKCI